MRVSLLLGSRERMLGPAEPPEQRRGGAFSCAWEEVPVKTWPGKRVLVTGGASGIGRALAEKLAESGAEILLADIDEPRMAATADAIRADGRLVHTHCLDVTDARAILRVRDAIHAQGGPIDVLVNNAGVVFGGAFLSVPLEKHLATYATNTLGLVQMTHAFLPDLISRPSAHVINIASAAGLGGLPFAATYASSKWSVIGFSESLRQELARIGDGHVRVTTVCAAYVSTGLFEGARPLRTTSLLSPERLARQIVRSVERDRVFLRTPWVVKFIPLVNGVLPVRMVDAVSRVLGAASSMERWTGHRPSSRASLVERGP
jgi:all-trans-retinol dehydrogenase (NAD+)